ncbi:MAG: EthD domain-containing protein [Panacagrimonas sp.]
MNDTTTEVTTVALLARRQGMSTELFSRYWRDVHGVLAVRIPGFWSYTQYHVEPGSPIPTDPATFRMDGFAEVIFRNEADRAGLANSQVTTLILRDEPNVFSRTLLYSLEAGASRTLFALTDEGTPELEYVEPEADYVLLARSPVSVTARDAASALDALASRLMESPGLLALRRHLLASGDPLLWNTVPGVDNAEAGARHSAVIQVRWKDREAALAAVDRRTDSRIGAFTGVQAYRVTSRCAMMVQGRPTHLGLRGLDVLRTIEAAGAENQKQAEVLRCLFGVSSDVWAR